MKAPITGQVALVLTLACVGCAEVTPIKPLDEKSPAMQGNGFSVTPPQEMGWQTRRLGNTIGFFKLLALPRQEKKSPEGEPQTFVITIETQRANSQDISTKEGLLRYAGRYATTVSPNRRQRLVSYKTSPYIDQGTDCVRFEAVIEEQPRKLLLDIRGTGFICRHPYSADHVVRGGYSERHVQGGSIQSPESAVREAEAVLKSVVFTPMR